MRTEELVAASGTEVMSPNEGRTRWWRRPWVVPLAVVAVGFVVYALPPYLSLDPTRARLQPNPANPLFYPLLVTHIFLGSIALLTACVQVWPWLRRTHPQIHRWSGRAYVAACLPAAVCTMIIAPMTLYGANLRVANTVLGALWFLTTLAGYRAVRQRRYADHREWMLRSVALAFSIVANRVWLMAAFAALIPEQFSGAQVAPAELNQAIGVASWLSWLVNLLAVEWWLQRTRQQRTRQLRTRQRRVVAAARQRVAVNP